MAILQQISQSIQQPAGVIQFAKDGKYEEAWIISLDQNKPPSQEINKYLQKDRYQKLIVEYIWNQDVDEHRYVLTVIHDHGCKQKDDYQFIQTNLDIFYDKLNFQNTISRIDQQIIGHDFLLRQPVQRVRLGVFNHWFSVGPIELWDQGDNLRRKDVEAKINARPEVKKSKLNYQGLAFIYNFDGSLPGPYHVLKTPTCHKLGEQWVVDVDLIYQNMKMILQNGQ